MVKSLNLPGCVGVGVAIEDADVEGTVEVVGSCVCDGLGWTIGTDDDPGACIVVTASLEAVDEAGPIGVVSAPGAEDTDEDEITFVTAGPKAWDIVVILWIDVPAIFGVVVIDVFGGIRVFATPGTEAANEVDENGIVRKPVENWDNAPFNAVSVAFGIEMLDGVLDGTVVFDRASTGDDSDGVAVTENKTREKMPWKHRT